MARKSPTLIVRITPDASRQLAQIWNWNAERYDPDHADRYEDFLIAQALKLGTDYRLGRRHESRPEYHYVIVRKGKAKSHGHVIVYEVTNTSVVVVFFFHTAQNWQI